MLVTHSVVRAKTKKPSLHNDNDNAAKTAKASSSEIGKAKAKAGHDTEMEIITQTRTGIRLTCRNGRVWIYTGRRNSALRIVAIASLASSYQNQNQNQNQSRSLPRRR